MPFSGINRAKKIGPSGRDGWTSKTDYEQRQMKCPYCAEEIKDAARVCRHCGRDLSLTIENEVLRNQISLLEQRVSELTASRGSEQIGNQPRFAAPKRWQTALAVGQAGLAAVLAALIPFVCAPIFFPLGYAAGTIFSIPSPPTPAESKVSASLISPPFVILYALIIRLVWVLGPLPLGYWAGRTLYRRNIWAYALLGASVGLIEGTLHALKFQDWNPSLSFVVLYIIVPSVLFFAGLFVGDLVKGRKTSRVDEPGLARAREIAVKLSPRGNEPSRTMVLAIRSLRRTLFSFLPAVLTSVASGVAVRVLENFGIV